MKEDTIICRCEEVNYREIKEAIALGLTSPGEIRKYTRAGMGSCQGRTCGHLLFQILRQSGEGDCSPGRLPKTRPPVRPAAVEELGEYE
ncbi:MAG: (2Fe-2S)-binding protein [Treponema sp.]|jgi:bacterioferritin-associated ferredoxin|nr:(2Fe-2S)-binding protein [Treponema sp.]